MSLGKLALSIYKGRQLHYTTPLFRVKRVLVLSYTVVFSTHAVVFFEEIQSAQHSNILPDSAATFIFENLN